MDERIPWSRHADSPSQTFLSAILPTLVLFLIAPAVGEAQVETSITSTIGAGDLGTHVTLPHDNIYDITGGTRPGDGPILYHSFGDFTVGAGDTANFLNTTPNIPTSNILGRVTGGPSNLFGTIDTLSYPGANLFLVNPFGIVFGPTASLNVGGSVSFTTAQYIRLFDSLSGVSANFYADTASDGLANSVLAVAPVPDFGFLNAAPAAYGFLTQPDSSATIMVQGSLLSVLPDQSISLVGGKVIVESGTPDGGTAQPAQLSAPKGRIQLATAASPGEFAAPPGESLAHATTLQAAPNNPLDQTSAVAFTSFGSVTMAPGSSIDGSSARTLFIKGGQLVLSVNDATLSTFDVSPTLPDTDTIFLSRGSSIVTSSAGADTSAEIQLIASNVQLDGASILSTTTGSERGGDISIADAQTVSLFSGAQIVSDTKGGGDGGNITIATINTPNSSVTASGFDSDGTLSGVVNPFVGIVTSGAFSAASAGGNGGQISITAPAVTLDNFGTFATINSGDGNGGNISINSTTVGLTNGASFLSSTGLDFTTGAVGSGNGGHVTVQGLPGAVDSAADAVTLSNGAAINMLAFGPGRSGDVQITAGSIGLDGFASMGTVTSGDGDGGNVTANVGTLSLTNGSSISSNNFSSGIGQGGMLTIQGRKGVGTEAVSVMLSNEAVIITETDVFGRGGDVVIAAGKVDLLDASTITTKTFGPGRGGDVHITADSLTLENRSGITTETSGLGMVGGDLFLNNNGGDLFLNVGRLSLLGGSFGGSLVRSTNSSTGTDLDSDELKDVIGVGGNITIQGKTQGAKNAAESVVLSGSSGITSDTRPGSGGGGRISIRATSLNLNENSSIQSSTSAIKTDLNGDGVVDFTGAGGSIEVSVQQLRVVDGATITSNTGSSSSSAAAGGTVTVQGLDGPGSKAGSVLFSDHNTGIVADSSGGGVPGDIAVDAESLTITNGALISAGSPISLAAGAVTVTADSVVISGEGSISSQSFAQGAKQVKITTNELTLDNGSIVTNTFSEIGGRGGDVIVKAGTVSLANGASINSQSGSEEAAFSTGRAGDITMNVGSLTLSNHAEITSSSKGTVDNAGDAGNVTITASGAFMSNASTIATSAENAKGGNIDITAHAVELVNGTLISASSRSPLLPNGEGDAGNVTVHSGSRFIMQNSSITTEATQASGGRIEATAPDMFRATNSKMATSVAGSEGDTSGGDITIDPIFVISQNSQFLAQAFAGTGGNINITSNVFLADPASIVDATSQLGISGTVNIQSPVQNVSGELVVLSHDFSSAAALLAQQCAARVADGKFSTFVVAAREGLPVEPGGFLPSPSFQTELVGPVLSGRLLQIPRPAAEGLFTHYDAKPLQLAKLGNACHR